MASTTNKYKFQGKPLNSYLTSGTNYPYSTTYFKDANGYVIQGKSVSASNLALKITDYFNYTGRYPNPTYYEIADAWKYWPNCDELIATLTNDTICASSTESRKRSLFTILTSGFSSDLQNQTLLTIHYAELAQIIIEFMMKTIIKLLHLAELVIGL